MITLIPFQTTGLPGGPQPVDRRLLEAICQALKEPFQQDCQIGPAADVPAGAYHPERRQYAAEYLLEALPDQGSEHVLGVADLDLYTAGLNYVFGLADSVSNRAVVALARLRNTFYGQPADPELFTERAIKESIHELGHTYGLGHCPDPSCVMFFSNSLADTDRKSRNFCQSCGELLLASREEKGR